jgi:hypothetical protein
MENNKIILNLTQHNATAEQIAAGVIDLAEPYKTELKKLLTFDELPSQDEIETRAGAIYDLIIDFCLDNNSPIKEEVEKMIISKSDNFGDKYIIETSEFKKLNLSFMIGGALWLMKPLIEELENIGTPLFAFSKREVIETPKENGEVEKKVVFKHQGFIKAF